MQWWKIVLGIIGVVAVGWFLKYITTPPPGTKMEDQGREHVSATQIASFAYNSNPPTSGSHDPEWIKPGVYTEPQKEGKLIHSLEHGYVIVHYSCTGNPNDQIPMTKQIKNPNIKIDATQSAVVNTEECKKIIEQLEEVVRGKKLKKLILVPRPSLDTRIALTAWDYIDKFNDFDTQRIARFIDFHRDHGPEKTME